HCYPVWYIISPENACCEPYQLDPPPVQYRRGLDPPRPRAARPPPGRTRGTRRGIENLHLLLRDRPPAPIQEGLRVAAGGPDRAADGDPGTARPDLLLADGRYHPLSLLPRGPRRSLRGVGPDPGEPEPVIRPVGSGPAG